MVGRSCCPVVGAIAAQKFPVVAGIGRRGETTMFVSRGLGTVYVPVRINCPPEVAVLTLQPGVSLVSALALNQPPAADRPTAVEHDPIASG